MALEMRAECERCRQPLCPEDVAFVCSFECTYCSDCAEVLGGICETCTGELVRRPRRRTARATAPKVAASEQQLPVGGAMQRSSSTPLADR